MALYSLRPCAAYAGNRDKEAQRWMKLGCQL